MNTQWINIHHYGTSSGENIVTTGDCVCVDKLSTQLLAKTTRRSPYQASFLVDTHKPLCLGGTVGLWWFCLVSVLSRIQRVRCASAPTSPLLSSLLQDLRERLGSIPDVSAKYLMGGV